MAELRLDNSIVDDRYLIDSCLGRGSYAEIFLAADEYRDGEQVIIKALNTSLQGTADPDLERTLVENFQNEAIALDLVRHANIIRRLGHGTAADLRNVPFHYLVLEYMPGGDLLALCRRKQLSLGDVLFYFKQVAEALAYAHSQGVIHRDMKPNNLLLSEDAKIIKIADFGVAKMSLNDNAEITRVGTNVYAPPEHHPDSPTDGAIERLTPSADIYSVAKTIYTALCAKAPRQFSRQPIADLPFELTRERWGNALLGVLNKATAERASDRFQTVQEFWNELAQLDAYLIESEEDDPEVTQVRSRLTSGSTVERAAAEPNFGSLTEARGLFRLSSKARIVVDLPVREKTAQDEIGANETFKTVVDEQNSGSSESEYAEQIHVRKYQQEQAAKSTEILSSQPEKPARNASSTAVQKERSNPIAAFIRSEWLKRVFIVLLLATLIGIVAQVYLYFAGGGDLGRRAVIFGPQNVNLRDSPSSRGEIVTVLPAGTRIEVSELRDGWAHVKVVSPIPGVIPSPEGWVDNRYVKEE